MSKPFILIAEDDIDDRFLLQTAFEESGYSGRLEFVADGVDLLDFLCCEPWAPGFSSYPVFILLDLNMPRKDGRQALREIKESESLRRIPVIVFSTTQNEAEINQCYQLGANSYIIKPLNFTSLVDIVEKIRLYWLHTVAVPA